MNDYIMADEITHVAARGDIAGTHFAITSYDTVEAGGDVTATFVGVSPATITTFSNDLATLPTPATPPSQLGSLLSDAAAVKQDVLDARDEIEGFFATFAAEMAMLLAETSADIATLQGNVSADVGSVQASAVANRAAALANSTNKLTERRNAVEAEFDSFASAVENARSEIQQADNETQQQRNATLQSLVQQGAQRVTGLTSADGRAAQSQQHAQNLVAQREQRRAEAWKNLPRQLAAGQVRMPGHPEASNAPGGLPRGWALEQAKKNRRLKQELLNVHGGTVPAGTVETMQFAEGLAVLEGSAHLYQFVVAEGLTSFGGADTARDAYELSSGKDIHGNDLSKFDRAVTAGFLAIPYVPASWGRAVLRPLGNAVENTYEWARNWWRQRHQPSVDVDNAGRRHSEVVDSNLLPGGHNGGYRLDLEDILDLKRRLAEEDIILVSHADEFLDSLQQQPRALFRLDENGNRLIYIRDGATQYDLIHEYFHVLDLDQYGEAAFRDMGPRFRELAVYHRLRTSDEVWELLTEAERLDAMNRIRAYGFDPENPINPFEFFSN